MSDEKNQKEMNQKEMNQKETNQKEMSQREMNHGEHEENQGKMRMIMMMEAAGELKVTGCHQRPKPDD